MKKSAILNILMASFLMPFGCYNSMDWWIPESGESGDIGVQRPLAFFPGAGTAGAGDSLAPGVGPETAGECGSGLTGGDVDTGGVEVIEDELDCFFGEDDTDSAVPAAAIERILEVVDDVERIHIRLTLNPSFVDNSFGKNAVGWENAKKGKHTFKDLVGSDHAEMKLFDSKDKLVLHFKVDYLSENKEHPSGYSTMGVTDGDGKMIEGDESAILGVATSLDRNLNGCELSEYTENSPETDALYTPSQTAGEWDYRVVYEVWVDAAPFGQSGFGNAIIEHVHASPSKTSNNTVTVIPGDCPDTDTGDDTIDTDTGPDTDDVPLV